MKTGQEGTQEGQGEENTPKQNTGFNFQKKPESPKAELAKNEPTKLELPPEDIKKLIDTVALLTKKVNDFEAKEKTQSSDISAETIAKVVEGAIKGNKAPENWTEGVDESQIDPEDYDEKGVRFCHPSMGYVISDDIRKGQIIRLPYNKKFIFFQHETTRIVQQGKYGATFPISSYTSHSKKEIKWIREHSIYGTVIFETTKQAMDQRAEMAMRIAPIMTMVQDYDYPSLMRRCQEYGIQMSDDTRVMRANLALAMAERSMEGERTQTESILFKSQASKGVAASLGK